MGLDAFVAIVHGVGGCGASRSQAALLRFSFVLWLYFHSSQWGGFAMSERLVAGDMGSQS